jgi:P27 family predicted phage terminase small subunit
MTAESSQGMGIVILMDIGKSLRIIEGNSCAPNRNLFLETKIMRPRKTIYDYEAVRQGSKAQKRREAKILLTAADRLTDPPEPPETMSTGARLEWLKLAPVVVELGTMCRGDLRAFEQLTETLAMQTELQELVRSQGWLLPTGTDSYKANPAVKSLETARNQSHRLLVEFGLTPKARNYVSKAPEPVDDEFSFSDL